MADPIYWRLDYASGRSIREHVENVSIRTAPPGASRLVAISEDGSPIVQVPLDGQRPIFYRRRSVSLGTGAPIRLDATVFGRAYREADGSIDGKLWAAIGDQIVSCPRALMDMAMIETQIEG